MLRKLSSIYFNQHPIFFERKREREKKIRKHLLSFRYVSQALFHLMEAMHDIVGRPLYTHCAGHSLGSHICGLTGKLLRASGRVPTFNRISAMDPAGPLFFNDVPYPWDNLHVTSASRLNSTDADLVDVIHTDGDARYLGYIPQVSQFSVKWSISTY